MAISERPEVRALRHIGDQRHPLVQRVRNHPNTVVRFDPKAEKFQSWTIPGGGNIVRNTSVTTDGDFVLASSLVNTVTLVSIPSRHAPQ